MKSNNKRFIIPALVLMILYSLSFSVFSDEAGPNDNFGDFGELVDTGGKLTLKEDAAFMLKDGILFKVQPGTDCASIISSFINDEVFVFAGETIINGSDIVCTSYEIKLIKENYAADSCLIAVVGDVNGDGDADSADASLVLKHDCSAITLDGISLAAADADGDGASGSPDAVLILRYDAGLTKAFDF